MSVKIVEVPVVWFKDCGKHDVGLVGGKAANLGELTNAGIPVPPGFTLPASVFTDFMRSTGLQGRVTEMLSSLDVHNSVHLERVAQEIPDFAL
jgi:pyruvate, water dikinase